MVRDKNAAAQEKAIGVAAVFVGHATREQVAAVAESLTKAVSDCFGASKTTTKAAAQQLMLLLIECDAVEVTVEQLLAACTHKTPKVRTAALEVLLDACKQFGASALPVKSILKALPNLFSDSDNAVRALATSLAVELHRTFGDLVATQLKDLRRCRGTCVCGATDIANSVHNSTISEQSGPLHRPGRSQRGVCAAQLKQRMHRLQHQRRRTLQARARRLPARRAARRSTRSSSPSQSWCCRASPSQVCCRSWRRKRGRSARALSTHSRRCST
jgi:hypothetical protein